MQDFLFDYYWLSPGKLKTWHPGVGVALEDAGELAGRAFYSPRPDGTLAVDADEFLQLHGAKAREIAELLRRTAQRPAHFDCFGLHEWAMVYRAENTRHDLPLRLGSAGSDEVVESHELRCTHFDAYRFFTPEARPRNATRLSRDTQPACEQEGCLHATMDLYKWAGKLGPLVPGELLLDCFELARDTRVLDMEASPYDVRGLGYGVVPIETPEGKRTYVARQKRLAARGRRLRARLLGVLARAGMPID